MDKRAAVDIVTRLRKGIEARGIRLQRVILYGSYVSGSNQEGSDIDVVVISNDFNGKTYWERIDILADAIYEIFAPVEAVALTPEEWDRDDSFISNIARNGELLYEA